jgi:hypothetical protein
MTDARNADRRFLKDLRKFTQQAGALAPFHG